MKEVIIIGGGASINEGMNLHLWYKIEDKETWSLNYAWKAMPYLPSRQIWIDHAFYTHNVEDMGKLEKQGVKIATKYNNRYGTTDHDFSESITMYHVSREPKSYKGRLALKQLTPFMYGGRMGLTGIFALSVAIAEGYDVIYLLGYDFGTPHIKDVRTHFYTNEILGGEKFTIKGNDEKLWSTGVGKSILYRNKKNEVSKNVTDFEVFVESGIEIINVSPQSNIECFPKITYPQFFEEIQK